MKKIIFIIFSFFLLASCGNNNSQAISIKTKEFVGSGFTMQVPENWTSTGNIDSFQNAGNGQLALATVSPEKKYNFHNNIVVVQDDLTHIMSSKQYGEQNNIQASKKYAEYTPITSGAVFFPDSDEGKYYVFDVKYNLQTPKLRNIELAKICGTRAYVLHAGLSLDSKYEDFIDILKSFSCK